MPAKTPISNEERRQIKKLYETDLLFASEIGLKLGLARSIVSRVLRELKVKSRGSYRPLAIGIEFNQGQLKVIRSASPGMGSNSWLQTRVWVRCRCNGPSSEFAVAAYKLRSGCVKSCGCLQFASPNYRPHPDREWGRVLRIYQNNYPGFALATEQIKAICMLPCFYCGLPPSNELKGRYLRVSNGRVVLRYSGIDQVVHGKGHTIGNILPACIICNRAKSSSSLQNGAGT
jgi:hypothetical protein